LTFEPGTNLGRYELQALLGAGGMGAVYRARDTRLNRVVAIKVLLPQLASDARLRERFEREARAVAALSHPNICAVYDVGDTTSTSYLVMELLDGETLDHFLGTHVLEPSDVIAFGLQIAAGLEAAHAKGIVHRDIKPGNVFVARGGVIKITDFGLALIAPPAPDQSAAETAFGDLTMPGSSVGTAAYMSPEQARGETVDARSDVFALGLVLFQMATGRPAFSGATLATVFDAVLNRTPPLATTIAPRVPVAVSHVIAKALEKDREQRYQRVADLSADLQRIANGAAMSPPVTAPAGAAVAPRPPGVRRVVIAGALLAFMAGAGAWMWWSAAARSQSSQQAQAPIRSLAVLPLENLSGGSDNDYFTDGMTEELITALAAVRGWRVISRTSVMPYKHARKPLTAIARELGVDAIVEGSIQQSARRVRITAKLVRAGAAEENLWAGSFDHDLQDVLDLENEFARAIADEIRITLTPQEQQRLTIRRPVDPELFQLLLKGRAAAQSGAEDDLFKAIGYFEQALAVKPDYAPAHAAMALAYEGLTPAFRAPKEVLPKAREHAVRAIELDSSLSEAHAALAAVMFLFDWDWANAGTEMQRAIELNPNSASAHELYGNYLTALNRKDAAISELTLAHQLNPAGLATYSSLLGALCTLREFDRAIAESRRALELHPDFAFAHAWLGMSLLMKGQVREALPSLERARMLDDNVTTTHFLAMAQAAAGNKQAAEALVSGLEAAASTRYTCAYEVASVHLQLGHTEKAMDWLRRGVAEQCDCLVWLKTEAWVDPLRVDPRYADLVKRVGFPAR
jgi:TolB-like protein/Tfp pilus assembly protein PilF